METYYTISLHIVNKGTDDTMIILCPDKRDHDYANVDIYSIKDGELNHMLANWNAPIRLIPSGNVLNVEHCQSSQSVTVPISEYQKIISWLQDLSIKVLPKEEMIFEDGTEIFTLTIQSLVSNISFRWAEKNSPPDKKIDKIRTYLLGFLDSTR